MAIRLTSSSRLKDLLCTPGQKLDEQALTGLHLSRRARILVVDDQPLNIQTLYQIFQADHDVLMATNGAKALEICRFNAPDLILLDVVMPEMDGIEVCQRLKSDPDLREIPVIFVTAQESPDDETRALEVGAVDFISKPVNPAVVRARVKTQLTLKAQSDVLRSLAFIDGLTGVANRRYFDEQMQNEWRACRRSEAPLSVLMIDVDYFKLYNDQYGHQEGDACLQAIAEALGSAISRPHDLIARYGGEEFTCLLPTTDVRGATFVANHFVRTIRKLNIPHSESKVAAHVTISVGVATVVPNAMSSPAALIAAADAQLYIAKNSGRNRFSTASIAKIDA